MSAWTSRARWVAAAIGLTLLAGCALPEHKQLDDLSKAGASLTVAESVLTAYAADRAQAETDLDSGALGDLEGGETLAIDQGAFEIRRALGISARPFAIDQAATFWAPRFTKYPLWFVALVRLPQQQQQMVCVFSRASTSDPWLLEAAPHLAGSTDLPAIATSSGGSAARYVGGEHPAWSDGAPVRLTDQPQQIADAYADVLTSKNSKFADEFVKDSFISQMREIRRAQPKQGVTFDEQWKAEKVNRVLRLADGGALMFVDLQRQDTFDVKAGSALSFTGSEAGAFLPDQIRHHARLTYRHQVLMVVPTAGDPLVIGQYGGLVDAVGG